MLAAAAGGLLLGLSLSRTQNRRLWLIVLGGLFGVAWIGTGGLAAGFAALGMYYLPEVKGPIVWDSYNNAFIFSGSHIRFLQFAAATGLVGGLSIGLGLAQKWIPVRASVE
jgi:hypothetical protein